MRFINCRQAWAILKKIADTLYMYMHHVYVQRGACSSAGDVVSHL